MLQENLPKITQLIPKIREYDADLEKQNLWWSVVAMVGKVNNQNMEGQLLDSITHTQEQFHQLRSDLIQNMVQRYLDKIKVNLQLKSQALVDTLNRNLFERTADVGFLATDEDLVAFLAKADFSEAATLTIQQRLKAYVQKYTVYDDVLLLLPNGQVVARIDSSVQRHLSNSSALEMALKSASFVEYDLPVDVLPNRNLALSYWQRITDASGQILGVLCLSFKFEDELKQLCKMLESGQQPNAENLCLLNEHHQILFTYQPSKLPATFPSDQQDRLLCLQLNGQLHFAYMTSAKGYQGFQGLPWRSVILLPVEAAFAQHRAQTDAFLDENSALFPNDLNELNLEVNTALLIVVLNGKIISLKNKVKAFLPVLDSFQEIGAEIRQIFSKSINHIHQVAHQTLAAEVAFLAELAMDIMDRNLYERANDCRWWALNSGFREGLSQPITPQTQQALTASLQSIHALYTVYQQLFIFDQQGDVVALSNPKNQALLGQNISHYSGVKAVLKNTQPQHYQVSDFEASPMYDDLPTYIYYATILHPQTQQPVGGVGVVFDAQPEFAAILQDFLPKDVAGQVLMGSFAAFVGKAGNILSVTDNACGFQVGDHFDLSQHLNQATRNGVFEWMFHEVHYLVGYQESLGYREYKITDGYQNSVVALIFAKS